MTSYLKFPTYHKLVLNKPSKFCVDSCLIHKGKMIVTDSRLLAVTDLASFGWEKYKDVLEGKLIHGSTLKMLVGLYASEISFSEDKISFVKKDVEYTCEYSGYLTGNKTDKGEYIVNSLDDGLNRYFYNYNVLCESFYSKALYDASRDGFCISIPLLKKLLGCLLGSRIKFYLLGELGTSPVVVTTELEKILIMPMAVFENKSMDIH